jgi:hypothetical protein
MANSPIPEAPAVVIAERVRRFAAEAPEELRWLAPFVAEFGALPLYLGWTEAIGIRPGGELVRRSTEGDFVGTRPVEDRGWRMTAVVVGSRRYPELRPLVPQRGPDDVECWCHDLPPLTSGRVIGDKCGGLGWLPP